MPFNLRRSRHRLSTLACGLLAFATSTFADPITVRIDAAAPGRAISPDLMGIFFEDLSYAADGGLYAELIQNRSFEYSALSRREWTNLTAWDLVPRGGKGSLDVDGAFPLHPNNPHYAVLEQREPGELALSNPGFDGIVVRAGESYDLSFFARRLYTGGRWDGQKSAAALPLRARLETKDGVVLAEQALEVVVADWIRLSAVLTPSASSDDARLVLVTRERGGVALDEISLFPRKTFRGRANGLRPDLAQLIADLKPRFIRFPGGCLVHGNGIPNFYRWQDTIGPIEQRRQQPNIWGYHQTAGLGYFEYFQFCEDIGAMPLPVVPAGVSCQNSGHTGGTGQQCIPLADMPAYIQDVLNLIDWANGPATSTWGAKRAAAGHPEPFGLRYLGVGNEDHITPGFQERFSMIFEAVRARHPEITVVGTVGPSPDGEDFEKGWKFADQQRVPMVDEHYYKSPQWFWDNLARYDTYGREKSAVYLGEYAAHDDRRRSTLRSALAEAAYLTSLERNADVVRFASYAPLLAKRGHTHWSPNLIYFTNTAVYPTINYEVQRLFGIHSGDRYLPVSANTSAERFAASALRDSATGTVTIKVVNGAATARPLRLQLAGAGLLAPQVELTVLTGADENVAREDGQPDPVSLATRLLPVSAAFDYEAPPFSLTVIRLPRP
jgi:alpha-L-arabinofuranosidase